MDVETTGSMDLGRGNETIHPMQEVSTTGGLGSMDVETNGSMDLGRGNELCNKCCRCTMRGLGSMDVETNGSMDLGRGNEMIHPIQEARPNRRMGLWIYLLFVVLNIVIFILAMFINDCPKNLGDNNCTLKFFGRRSFQTIYEDFLFGHSSATLQKMGALEWSKVVREHQGWRLITCIFLHAGAFHLFCNMCSLMFIGIHLEQEFGFVRIGIVYLVSAFGGCVLSALVNQNGVSVGASGAFFGLLGMMLSELITNWTIYDSFMCAYMVKLPFIVFSVPYGLLPGSDKFAHIGGFMSGFLLGFVFLMWNKFGRVNRKNIPSGYAVNSRVKIKHNVYHSILGMLFLFLLVVGVVGGIIMYGYHMREVISRREEVISQFRNIAGVKLLCHNVTANKQCFAHGIHYMPTSRWSCKDGVIADGVIACQEFQSEFDFILICENGGKTKVYPGIVQKPTEAKKRQLCNQQCS